MIDNLRRYAAAGGQVALGTDYVGYTTPFQLGMPIKEMEWMLEAEMSPMQVIVAGTRNAAQVCNMGKDLLSRWARPPTSLWLGVIPCKIFMLWAMCAG